MTKLEKFVIVGILTILVIALILVFILRPKQSPPACGWSYGDWSDCDAGNKIRNVNCKSSEGSCSEDKCKETKPTDISESCTRPDSCSWSYSSWSDCSKEKPHQNRTATCQNTSSTRCDSSECREKELLEKPCVLSCCDKSKTLWSCKEPIGSTCPTTQTPTYDCSSCMNATFPSNVYIFTTADSIAVMQDKINTVFGEQGGSSPENNGQNSPNNYAFLFMPGTYTIDIPIGYYTHVAGLGKSSSEVQITGGPVVHNASTKGEVGALNNFWRSCENMTVNPTALDWKLGPKTMTYAVSQACSLRSVNINGGLSLAEMIGDMMGYSSGGFMANCKISGRLDMGSQQQFICRNTEYGTFPDISWNHVNVGCKSAPETIRQGCCIPTPLTPVEITHNLTVVDSTPKVFEKPYLASDQTSTSNDRETIIKSLVVLCPGLRSNSSGITTTTSNVIHKTSDYRIVTSDITADMLNAILSDPNMSCIIFSPGRYNIDGPINLTGQLLFGLGVPVLRSTNGLTIVSGYGRICGMIFDAGPGGNGKNSTLVDLSLKTQPSYLWDVYCRVGGGVKNSDIYEVDTMLRIGGDNSILDNVWCWVADHYGNDNSYVGWDKAICRIGLHVTGDNVIAYGLFAEHTRHRNVLWEGNDGYVYMFQSEFNYYIPSDFDVSDWVSYEIGTSVKKHTLYGAGAYSFFEIKPTAPNKEPMAKAGFKWGSSTTVDYQNLVTVSLDGYGGISRVFNDEGIPVQHDTTGKTQIAIVCKDNSTCDCYPKCDTSKSTCSKGVQRCKPNDSTACSDEIVLQSKCALSHNWSCLPSKIPGCFNEAQTTTDCPSNNCQLW